VFERHSASLRDAARPRAQSARVPKARTRISMGSPSAFGTGPVTAVPTGQAFAIQNWTVARETSSARRGDFGTTG